MAADGSIGCALAVRGCADGSIAEHDAGFGGIAVLDLLGFASAGAPVNSILLQSTLVLECT